MPQSDTLHALLLVAVMTAVTAALRFLPFVLFARGTPRAFAYLGNVLPYAVMAMLVVYCLKGITPLAPPYGLPELLAVLAVVLLHKARHNTLLSIVAGTALYMVLVQHFPVF